MSRHKKKSFEIRCKRCRNHRAIWAVQYLNSKQLRTRPRLCDFCIDQSLWRPTIVVTHGLYQCREKMNELFGMAKPSDVWIVLENKTARLIDSREKELKQPLPASVLIQAGQVLYKSEYADEFEDRGQSFPFGTNISDYVADVSSRRILHIMMDYELRLARAWGKSPAEVFELMGVIDPADALYYTLMACRGHGIGLEDDYGEELSQYWVETGERLDTAPFHFEMTEMRDLASEVLSLKEHIPAREEE